MKLLLDQGLPRGAAVILREAGFDAVHTGEIEMARAGDQEILARAAGERRVVVTLDSDFSMLLALSGAQGPSVIHLRLQGLTGSMAASLIWSVVKEYAAALDQGVVVSLGEEGALRLRKLPIIRG